MLDCLFETLATTKANISFAIHVNASQNSGHSSTEVTRFCFQSTPITRKTKIVKAKFTSRQRKHNINIKWSTTTLIDRIENVSSVTLNSFTSRVTLLYSVVPLIVSFLFLRTMNRRSILRLFSPLLVTPSDSAMAIREINHHGTDIERKRNIIGGTKQNCSFCLEEISPNSLISARMTHPRRLGPRKLSEPIWLTYCLCQRLDK